MNADTNIASGSTAGDNPVPVIYWNNVLKYENASYPDSSGNYNFYRFAR